MHRPTKPLVLIDTREKKPWDFFDQSKTQKLNMGDYTIEGLEDRLAIERKASVREFALNCGSDWPRFRKRLLEMSEIDYPMVVCEFTMREFRRGSSYSIVPVPTLLGRLSQITLDLGIPVLLVGKEARHVMPFIVGRFFARYVQKTLLGV